MAQARLDIGSQPIGSGELPEGSEFLVNALRRNWRLASAIPALFALGWFFYLAGEPSATMRQNHPLTAHPAGVPERADSAAANFDLTQEQRVRRQIESALAQIDSEPDSPDVPEQLHSVAALYYAQLHDYDQAIQYYLQIVHDHPEWNRIGETYLRLAECYAIVGDRENETGVYREILHRFPAGSRENRIAALNLET